MLLPPEKRVKFFVYIVESPSAADLYQNRSEGMLLKQMLELSGTPCITRTAISRSTFNIALSDGIFNETKQHVDRLPIIHISAHGDHAGIVLSTGDKIDWNELRELLKPINEALHGSLLVAMSCCNGYSGTAMAMTERKPPYYALVGNYEKPTWSETAIAFASFYHLISNGEYLSTAVEAMCAASGNKSFKIELAIESRVSFLEFVRTMDIPTIIEALQAMTSTATADKKSKASELEQHSRPS